MFSAFGQSWSAETLSSLKFVHSPVNAQFRLDSVRGTFGKEEPWLS